MELGKDCVKKIIKSVTENTFASVYNIFYVFVILRRCRNYGNVAPLKGVLSVQEKVEQNSEKNVFDSFQFSHPLVLILFLSKHPQ